MLFYMWIASAFELHDTMYWELKQVLAHFQISRTSVPKHNCEYKDTIYRNNNNGVMWPDRISVICCRDYCGIETKLSSAPYLCGKKCWDIKRLVIASL